MDAEREKGEQVLVALLNKALRQVPFVRLDCVDGVTALFQDALDFMEGHLELGDSDDEDEEGLGDSRQLSSTGLSSRGAVTHRPMEEKDSGGAAPVLPSAPAGPGGRLGLGSGGGGGGGAPAALPPASLATKLIGSTVTRDYSSPSQSKRSLSGGLAGKRGSVSSIAAVGGPSSTAPAAQATSPTSAVQLPSPSSSLSSSSASALSSAPSPSSASQPSLPPSSSAPLKLGLGGLKGQGALSSGHSSAHHSHSATSLPPQSQLPSSASSPFPSSAASASSSSEGGPAAGGAAGGVGLGGGAGSGLGLGGGKGGLSGGGGLTLGPSHKPSSRAQFGSAAAGSGGGPSLSDEEKDGGGGGGSGGGGSGGNSGQSSDNDDEVIRVARPLAAKNKLLHRAAGLSSREFPSPKLGPRSLGTSPAGMGPRGVSAPNNQQTAPAAGGVAGAAPQSLGLSGHSQSQRGPVLTHAASVGATASGSGGGGLGALQSSLTAPPSLSTSTSASSEAGVDADALSLPPLPEPSTSLGGGDDPLGFSSAAGSAFILTEPLELGQGHEALSEKEALGIVDGEAAEEEKDLVDEAMEKRPDPLAKLRNEVIVPVTASPKQFRSSLRLLTLAAESAASADGVAPIQPMALSDEEGGGAKEEAAAPAWSSGQRGLHSLSTGVAAAPLSASAASTSPLSSASNTPKPAFLRRLDSPESHHGQLIAAKARLQLLINRAVQTIPNLKKDAFPQAQQKLEAALAKLEHSTIQP